MIKSIETTGINEEEAIKAALSQLGLSRDDVSVEILDRGKKGFLGIGSVPARVKISYEAPEETFATPSQAESNHSRPEEENKAPSQPAPKKQETLSDTPVQAPAPGTKEEQVYKFLTGLFTYMDVTAQVSVSPEEDNTISVELSGQNVGALIGRRGETLDAIQHLANYVVNSDDSEHTRINIDAENYRAKRTDALISLAKKVAGKVVRYRRNVTLEPMNAYERHVIHTALQDYPGVTTFSTGTEPNRRIVVSYVGGGSYHSGRGGQRRDRSGSRPPRRDRTPQTEQSEAKPVQPEPVKNTTREWH